MFSTFLTDVLQDLLKESFPKFAYWLFYSEMALALLLGILFCFAWPVGTLAGLAFFGYAALCWVGACNYTRRKRAVEKKLPWEPSQFDRAAAIFMSAGLIVAGAGFILIALDGNWGGVVLGAALILFGGFNIVRILSGKWVTFP
ncbi:MAG: hypothetical protein WBC94_15760 [Xanthobacteraceae bacterium]